MNYSDVIFCACGAILITRDIEKEIQEHKEVAVICGHCGNLHIIGGHPYFDEEGNEGVTIYHRAEQEYFKDNQTILDTKKYAKIIYNKGIRVPLMNGEYARYGGCSGYVSYDRMPTHMIESEIFSSKCKGEPKTYAEIVEEWNENGARVDMQRLISENAPEDLEIISDYAIKGFNWDGTPYSMDKRMKKRKYHKKV